MRFSRTNQTLISRFWMDLCNVKVWFASGDVKEPVGHLKNDWEWLEIGFPLASRTRFFHFWNRVCRAIFLSSCDWYALGIYTGRFWDWIWKELINIQWKSNLIFSWKSNFQNLINFNPILPFLLQFRIGWHLWVNWTSRKE